MLLAHKFGEQKFGFSISISETIEKTSVLDIKGKFLLKQLQSRQPGSF